MRLTVAVALLLAAAPLAALSGQGDGERIDWRGAMRADHRPLPDWSEADLSWLGNASQFDASRAACADVRAAEPPVADWPDRAEAQALQGCSSFALYHGLDGPADMVKARHCALLEREDMGQLYADEGSEPYAMLEGPGMLAMLYANGEGVARDTAVATHMACEMGGAAAEMDLRIARLATWQGTDFDPCGDVTSGRGASLCVQYEAQVEERSRTERLEELSSRWPPAQRDAFRRVDSAFAAYATQANAMNGYGALMGWQYVWQDTGTRGMIDRFTDRLLAVVERRPVPPLPAEPRDGDWSVPRGPARAATMTEAEWRELLAEAYDAEDRALYESHREDAIAARRTFEPELVRFLALARPDLSAHEVRVLFRDF